MRGERRQRGGDLFIFLEIERREEKRKGEDLNDWILYNVTLIFLGPSDHE